MNNNNNNNNISKKVAGYSQCRQFLCYIINEQGIKLWTAEGQIHLHVVFEVRLEHRIVRCTDYSATLSLLPGDISLSEM